MFSKNVPTLCSHCCFCCLLQPSSYYCSARSIFLDGSSENAILVGDFCNCRVSVGRFKIALKESSLFNKRQIEDLALMVYYYGV